MPRFDTVLLDLDGTLSEAGPAITAAIAEALAACGHPPLPPEALRAFVGPPLEVSCAALPGFDEALVRTAVRVYRERYDLLGSPLYPGVVPALERLRAAGLRLALATSKPEPFAAQIVAARDLARLLDVVCGSGVDGELPTKADVVGETLRRLEGAPRPVMVGDREHDVLGAAAHGVPCIGALWGYGDEAELRAAGAVTLARDLDEVVDLVLGSDPLGQPG
jgi:phosphoglycolate phosphatase